jgi:hypothetical protein
LRAAFVGWQERLQEGSECLKATRRDQEHAREMLQTNEKKMQQMVERSKKEQEISAQTLLDSQALKGKLQVKLSGL